MCQVLNKRLDEDVFLASRKEILNIWRTGAQVDLGEAIEHQRQLMERGQNAVLKLMEGRSQGHILLQPRAGVATVEENLEILTYLQDFGYADILPLTTDSSTRNLRLDEVEHAIEKSEKQGRSFLNGFPVVNHGVVKTRKMIDSLSRPLHMRSAAVDRRIITETGLAAGVSAITGGPIVPPVHLSKDYPVEQAIDNHRYDFRLCAYYQEHGVPILVSVHGLLPCACLPPSLIIAPLVLEALLIAEQGVKYIGADYTQNGSLVQDVASLRVCPELVGEYLSKLGYKDVTVFNICSQYNGAFPEDPARCYGLISYLTTSAVWAGVDEILVKTPEQGRNLPSKESNAAALRTVRMVINMLKDQKPFASEDVDAECEAIRREVRSFLDRVLELGDGDAAVALTAGFDRGLFPVPFTSNRRYAEWADVMTARDAQGCVRFVDFGNMPLDGASKEFHKEKVKERERLQKRKVDYELVAQSIISISQGTLVR